jgi:hypothetical protein
MVETKKVRTIGVSGNVGKSDILRRGSWIVREGEMQRRQLLCTAGNSEDVEVTKCMEVSGIIILKVEKGPTRRLLGEEILDQASWVLEDLQF